MAKPQNLRKRQSSKLKSENIDDETELTSKNVKPHRKPKQNQQSLHGILLILLLMVGLTWGIAATSYFGIINYRAFFAQTTSITTDDITTVVSLLSPIQYEGFFHPLRYIASFLIATDDFVSNIFTVKDKISFIDKRRITVLNSPVEKTSFSWENNVDSKTEVLKSDVKDDINSDIGMDSIKNDGTNKNINEKENQNIVKEAKKNAANDAKNDFRLKRKLQQRRLKVLTNFHKNRGLQMKKTVSVIINSHTIVEVAQNSTQTRTFPKVSTINRLSFTPYFYYHWKLLHHRNIVQNHGIRKQSHRSYLKNLRYISNPVLNYHAEEKYLRLSLKDDKIKLERSAMKPPISKHEPLPKKHDKDSISKLVNLITTATDDRDNKKKTLSENDRSEIEELSVKNSLHQTETEEDFLKKKLGNGKVEASSNENEGASKETNSMAQPHTLKKKEIEIPVQRKNERPTVNLKHFPEVKTPIQEKESNLSESYEEELLKSRGGKISQNALQFRQHKDVNMSSRPNKEVVPNQPVVKSLKPSNFSTEAPSSLHKNCGCSVVTLDKISVEILSKKISKSFVILNRTLIFRFPLNRTVIKIKYQRKHPTLLLANANNGLNLKESSDRISFTRGRPIVAVKVVNRRKSRFRYSNKIKPVPITTPVKVTPADSTMVNINTTLSSTPVTNTKTLNKVPGNLERRILSVQNRSVFNTIVVDKFVVFLQSKTSRKVAFSLINWDFNSFCNKVCRRIHNLYSFLLSILDFIKSMLSGLKYCVHRLLSNFKIHISKGMKINIIITLVTILFYHVFVFFIHANIISDS